MRSSRSTPALSPTATLPLTTRIAALALATVVTACEGDSPADLATMWDSAGVTIVESHAPQWPEGTGWTVAPEPLLEVGSAAGDPAEDQWADTGARAP